MADPLPGSLRGRRRFRRATAGAFPTLAARQAELAASGEAVSLPDLAARIVAEAAATYPFLAAEQRAQAAVHGAVDLVQTARVVLAEAAAWKAYGAAIKEMRRTAKEKVGVARDLASAMAVLEGLAWPEPPAG